MRYVPAEKGAALHLAHPSIGISMTSMDVEVGFTC